MIMEALTWFRKLCDQAHGCDVVDLSQFDDTGIYGVYDRRKGELNFRDPHKPLRQYIAYDLDSFEAMVKAAATAPILVFVGNCALTALLHETRMFGASEHITFPLTITEEVKLLADPVWRDQCALLYTLRTLFVRAGVDDFVVKLRNLKVSRSAESGLKIEAGKASLTSEVTEALGGADGPLPETLDLSLTYFEELVGLVSPQRVRCAIEINTSDAVTAPFYMEPLPGELAKLLGTSLGWLYTHLSAAFNDEDKVTVVIGSES